MAGHSAEYGAVARPYARALFEVAQAANTLDQWSTALGAAAAIVADRSAGELLGSPSLDDAKRLEFVEGVLGGVPEASVLESPQGRALLKLLVENDRLEALSEISAAFDELKARAQNRIKVKLVAATQMDDDLKGKLAEALERRFGRQVDLETQVDESLIGGAIIQAEDRVIDGSVRARLKRLTDSLIA